MEPLDKTVVEDVETRTLLSETDNRRQKLSIGIGDGFLSALFKYAGASWENWELCNFRGNNDIFVGTCGMKTSPDIVTSSLTPGESL